MTRPTVVSTRVVRVRSFGSPSPFAALGSISGGRALPGSRTLMVSCRSTRPLSSAMSASSAEEKRGMSSSFSGRGFAIVR